VINWGRLVKAVLGIIMVLIVASVVYNWWGDYKSASVAAVGATTQTVNPDGSQIATGTSGTTYGIIRIDGVNFRQSPATNAKLIHGLKKGDKVLVLAKEGQWYKVKDTKGKTGWVTASTDYVALRVQ
jgi:uncharacterized protein YgiM (DUF1202 family)